MPIVKMKYGIDLGTTNSSLCKFENGELKIVKSDTLKDTMPSCVSFVKKNNIRVGDAAYNDLRAERARATKKWSKSNENVFLEFKRTMGLDTEYTPSNIKKSYTSEDLSAEVLKNLLRFVSDDVISACVITVPAKFKTDQIAATKRAADLAGITHCELLQEPIAAAIAYGLKAENKQGKWLVFDFGGGTFDVALLHVQDGILQVKDTEGDNYLGGKNLDYALVDQIFIPYLQKNNTITSLMSKRYTASILRDALKFYAEYAKNELSSAASCDILSQLNEFGTDDKHNDIELDFTITQEEIKPILEPFFQKAIDICKNLLKRNNLTGNDIDSLILVGGPTHSELLRNMLREQITPHVDTTIDPMTAVALGSALFASSIDYEEDVSVFDKTEKLLALDVNYESSTVDTLEYVTVKPIPNQSKKCDLNNLKIEIVRNDNAWSSGRIEVGEKGEVFECLLLEDRANSFTIHAYDKSGSSIPCTPHEISILQGTKIVNAVLPYYIGVEISNIHEDRDVFSSFDGLEKNVTLPAVGTLKKLHLPNILEPGNTNEKLILPIYQGEYNANGSIAMYNDHVFDVVITGDDVKNKIGALSEFDIVINVDRSQMMTLRAHFHDTGDIVEKPIEVSRRKSISIKNIEDFYESAKNELSELKSNKFVTYSELENTKKLLKDITSRLESEKLSDDGRMHLLADLRRTFLLMDKVKKKYEVEPLLEEADSLFEDIEEANTDSENEWDDEVNNAKIQLESAKKSLNINQIKQTIDNLREIYFGMTFEIHIATLVSEYYENFDPSKWKDVKKAKMLLKKYADIIIRCDGNLSHREAVEMMKNLIDIMNISESQKAITFI